MKKTLLALTALTALTSASAANYVGASVGSGLSLHYQTDRDANSAMRYSLNLDAVNLSFSNLAVGGSVDYLANIPGSANSTPVTPYYGLGLGAGVSLGNGSGVSVYPHALLGAKFQVTDPLNVFGEVNAGPALAIGGGSTAFGFGWGFRVGVNYMLSGY